MGLDFKTEPLDCEPFYHGYGMNCSETELVFGIWKLPIIDLKGNKMEIPFYITKGDGVLLLGNSILKLNSEHLLVFKPGKHNNFKTEISLPIFTTSDSENRTHLHIVPSQVSQFMTYFSSSKSMNNRMGHRKNSSRRPKEEYFGRTAKDFATRLHLYTHMSLRDMVIICRKGKILTFELLGNLQEAVSKCTSCKSTGKPLQVRKVSLAKFLKTFNESVQLDFMRIKALTEYPILQIRDRSTGFCNAVIAPSKEMDVAARLFQVNWVNQHGPPIEVSADPEFNNDDFVSVLKKYGTKYNASPARRHSKTGCVESGNTTLRVITERLLKDAQYYKNLKGLNYTEHEILSKAVFLTNVLHGQKNCSAFELARGYLPALSGLPQMPLNKDFLDAHQEQVVRRAISKLLRSKVPQTIASSLLQKGQAIYFHEKKTKKAIWDIGFVQDAREHYVVVSRSKKARGKLLKIAYEDIRIVPETSLLYELEKLDLELGSENLDSADDNVDSNENLKEKGSSNRDLNEQGSQDTSESDSAEDVIKPHDNEAVSREASLWASHPSSSSYLTSNTDAQYRGKKLGSVLDIGNPSSLSKDIGDTPLINPQVLPIELESVEQTILRKSEIQLAINQLLNLNSSLLPDGLFTRPFKKKKKISLKRKPTKKPIL